MLETKVLTQRNVYYSDSHRDELPAFYADVGLVTASPDVVVIRQIDIEAYFFGDWAEGGEVLELFPVARIGTVNGADFETRWHETEDVLTDAVE